MTTADVLAIATALGPPYPTRPPDAHVVYVTGRLLRYDLGNRNGALTIEVAGGRTETFVVARPNTINGHHYRCQNVPWVGEPERMRHWGCDEVPPIVVRRSIVRVTYWLDRGARVSDEVATVR